ncbi:uncharacterized protein BXZ73DRAFT_102112 [Epithele typhae]|uniref:uncharacterized protein n=1 Tax=Epithele typhae TaxID=378194 RepID=UPI002007CEF4|nr:uncharacterized protein BXZ73DRAFT_102112 [Epithele typhae]KAH9929584.1 hypothetical protein BXZ73DRAFT_102112 [Epithele typhae]
MPLFRSSSPPPAPPPAEAPTRSGTGFFSRGRAESPEPVYNQSNGSASVRSGSIRSGGFFSRRRSSSSDSAGHHDLKKDPSIVAARQMVTDAESAESAADRALMEARAAVRATKEHVRLLEQEALEEARRAKAKQAEVKVIQKTTGRLGRHG